MVRPSLAALPAKRPSLPIKWVSILSYHPPLFYVTYEINCSPLEPRNERMGGLFSARKTEMLDPILPGREGFLLSWVTEGV